MSELRAGSEDRARMRAEQLYRFAQAAAAAEDVETVLEAALTAIQAALGVNRAAILTLDAQRVMRFQCWRNLSDEYRRTVEGHSPWRADVTAPEPVLVADVEQEPGLAGFSALFRREGVGALAFIPLVTRGRLLGKFMLYYEHPHAFSEQEVETSIAIANHLASVIARFSALANLEETVRANELFAAVLAHDLQNPLGAIMTAAQLLLMRHEGESSGAGTRDTKPLSRILSSGQRMSRMIEQLLDFSRARTGGGIRVQPRESDLGELVEQALSELELANPDWKTTCETIGDPRGSWDSDRLLQVISNLVANAGQHGSPAKPVALRLDGSSPDSVRLEVHNDGAIPEALLPQLFDPFRKSRDRRSPSRGLGLGLYIVREIVRAHGGAVQVSSSEAAGTTFSVVLPRNVPPHLLRDSSPHVQL